METLYFNSNLLPEIKDLPVNDIEKIVQALHWAIAEQESYAEINLMYLRGGVVLKIASYDFSEVYNCFKRT